MVVGPTEGVALGTALMDGVTEGDLLGVREGPLVGEVLGDLEGPSLGTLLGDLEGPLLGDLLGDNEGTLLGNKVGARDGDALGMLLNWLATRLANSTKSSLSCDILSSCGRYI